MPENAEFEHFIGVLLPKALLFAIQKTKPLTPVTAAMDRMEIEAGDMALRISVDHLLRASHAEPNAAAAVALRDGVASEGTMALARLVMWVRLLRALGEPASPADGPDGRNALCVYLAETINVVWRCCPDALMLPYEWEQIGLVERLSLAESFAERGVLPHPEVLDAEPRAWLRQLLALNEPIRRADSKSHYFILAFAAESDAGRAAVLHALARPDALRGLAAGALGRLAPEVAAKKTKFGAESAINAECAAWLLREMAVSGLRTEAPQVGWAWDERPDRLCALNGAACRALEVALSGRPLLRLQEIVSHTGRVVGHADAWRAAASPAGLALDFCGAMARELYDRARGRWPTDRTGNALLEPDQNPHTAQLLRRHVDTPSLVDQYVDLLIAGGIAPDDVAIPAGPEIPGTTYGPVDSPLTFRQVFAASLPAACLSQFESRHREAAMSAVIEQARRREPDAPLSAAPSPRRRISL